MTEIEKIAKHWGEQKAWEGGAGLHWTEIPAVVQRLNKKVSGRTDVDWVTHTLTSHFIDRLPLENCLSLGCGFGGLERQLAGSNAFISCDAYDVAPKAILEANQLATDHGYSNIHYTVADINHLFLPSRFYDGVWVNSSMHHFTRLEFVIEQIHNALLPNGLLILHEYVGASHFQFPEHQKEVLHAAFQLLPLKYRRLTDQALTQTTNRNPVQMGLGWTLDRLVGKLQDRSLLYTIRRRLKLRQSARSGQPPMLSELVLPTLNDVTSADPSEAVRSAEILDIIKQFFTIVEQRELGGTLLQFLLAGIAGNFNDTDPDSMRLLEMLFEVEDTLISTGDLSSDFVYLVVKPI